MSNIINYPLEDNFETTLAQNWDGQLGPMTVNKVPTFTFPAGVTTYVVVDPLKTNMQVAEIDGYNPTNKTLNVTNIVLEKGASVNSVASNHNTGATVIISDNYQFWKDILTAVNSKLGKDETNVVNTGKIQFTSTTLAQLQFQNLTTTERTTLGGLLGATDNLIVKDTTDGEHYKWNGSIWETIDTGTPTPNASETVAGKVEMPVQVESDDGDEIGGTGAKLSTTPLTVGRSMQKQAYIHAIDTGAVNAYAITLKPVPLAYVDGMKINIEILNTNTLASTINVNSLGVVDVVDRDGDVLIAGQLTAGQAYDMQYEETNTRFVLMTVSKASDAEASTGTNDTKYITAKQLKSNALNASSVGSFTRAESGASGAVTYAHGLGKVPKSIIFDWTDDFNGNSMFNGFYASGVNKTFHNKAFSSFCIESNNQRGFVSSADTINFTITWTLVSSDTDNILVNWIATA